MPELYDDFCLLNDCIEGKREAWNLFVKRFSNLVYYSITKTLKNHACNLQQENIEDIYNTIFLSFIEKDYRKLRQFEGKEGCSPQSWIRLISIRQTIDFLRNQNKHSLLDSENDGPNTINDVTPNNDDSIENKLIQSETKGMFKEAVEDLPAADKLFMNLYFTKELELDEIAKIMHISVSAVYSKKNRVREKIKKILIKKNILQ